MAASLQSCLVLVMLATSIVGLPEMDQRSLSEEDAQLQRKLKALVARSKDLQAAQGLKSEGKMTVTRDWIVKHNYPVAEYTATTSDGYLLNVVRMPNPGKPVVFLMHGLLMSSADYVQLGKDRGIAMILYDAGFDIWMGNARGTTESRRHQNLTVDDAAFWDFSWHEIGSIDVPAMLDLVYSETGEESVHYLGYSQGTTAFFVLASERPEYMPKIKTYTGMAPVAFVRDVRSIPLRLLAVALNTFGDLIKMIGINEFLPSSDWIAMLGNLTCGDEDVTQPACSNILFLICGYDPEQLDNSIVPDIMTHAPAGASTNQLIHYGQMITLSDLVFRQFDHGWVGNMQKYGSLTPPEYDLGKVTAPTYLFHSDNDLLAVQSNVDMLKEKLPNLVRATRVNYAAFSHLDFVYANDVKSLVYDELLSNLLDYESQHSN